MNTLESILADVASSQAQAANAINRLLTSIELGAQSPRPTTTPEVQAIAEPEEEIDPIDIPIGNDNPRGRLLLLDLLRVTVKYYKEADRIRSDYANLAAADRREILEDAVEMAYWDSTRLVQALIFTASGQNTTADDMNGSLLNRQSSLLDLDGEILAVVPRFKENREGRVVAIGWRIVVIDHDHFDAS